MGQHGVKKSALAAAMLGALWASVAVAQDAPATNAPADVAPAKEKLAKPKASKLPSVAVLVINHRSVGLVELIATMSGGVDPVKIAGPLAANKKIIARVAHDKACLFDLKGSFADGADMDSESVDLCKDKKIDLLD